MHRMNVNWQKLMFFVNFFRQLKKSMAIPNQHSAECPEKFGKSGINPKKGKTNLLNLRETLCYFQERARPVAQSGNEI